MRVFVAGATGVLGRELLPRLKAAGHEPFGLARTPEKLLSVSQAGASPERGDVLDAAAIRRIFTAVRPEAIVNLATSIPLKLRVNPADWQQNDRVRVEGSRNLMSAAREVGGVRLYLQESVGYVCASRGGAWMDEESPRTTHPFLTNTLYMEDQIRGGSIPASILRFGLLLSPESWHLQQLASALKRGLFPIIGNGDSYVSPIHVQDAAGAILAALDRPGAAAGQTFNVCDDDPAMAREVTPYAARLLHAPDPHRVPVALAKLAAGALTVDVLSASYRLSNAKLRRVLSFSPAYPTYRESWAHIASALLGRNIAPAPDLG